MSFSFFDLPTKNNTVRAVSPVFGWALSAWGSKERTTQGLESELSGVQGSGFRVQGSGCRAQGSGFRVQGSGFRVQGSGFRIQDSGIIRVQGAGCGVRGLPDTVVMPREPCRV